MTTSTRNLLIVFSLLLLFLGYQVFFTDAYDGMFGNSASSPTRLAAPEVATPARDTPATPAGETTSTPETETELEPESELESELELGPASEPAGTEVPSDGAAPASSNPDARFRSEQLLRDSPDENPFRSVTDRPSALFDPGASGPAIPLSPTASASVLENGKSAETSAETPETSAGSGESAAAPTQPASTQSSSHTARRVHTAPVLRLDAPAVGVSAVTPEFTPLFSALAPAPLIRTTRQTVNPSAVKLPTSLPAAPVAELGPPATRTPVTLSERVAPPVVPYFADLAIFPVIAFTADNRHPDPASVPRTARIRDLRAYFDEIELTFTGTARGSVTVGVFRSTLTLGPVVLAVGQTLPETDIALTRLTTTEAEFTLGDQTRVLTLNLRW